MDRGFVQAGHRIIWANEWNNDACATYAKGLHLKPVCQDIRTVQTFPYADLLLACNPCQGFSIIGPRNPKDKRNFLYKEIERCLSIVKPKFFVTENVRGLKWLYAGRFFEKSLADYTKAGYNITWRILNAKDYGVPQDRWRLFIVGVRKDINFKFDFPDSTNGPGKKPYITLRKSIGRLPKPKSGEFFNDPSFSFFYMSRNRRRSWDEVSFTIQASGRHTPLHPSSPPMIKIGKDKWQFSGDASKVRRLSVKECAIIQSFKEDDVFIGNLLSQYLQIGNAVPPLLAYNIAKCFDNYT
jgi:DNA (cytosine-5)-methyltransferase 1